MVSTFVIIIIFFFLGSIGVWTQGLLLAMQVLEPYLQTFLLFLLVAYWTGSYIFTSAGLELNLPDLSSLLVTGITGQMHHNHFREIIFQVTFITSGSEFFLLCMSSDLTRFLGLKLIENGKDKSDLLVFSMVY
jgi:hypothetical protein